MTNPSEWHNTGSNGRASEVWCKTEGELGAYIYVMPYRCLVDVWKGDQRVVDRLPFPTLPDAKLWADSCLTEQFNR